MPVSSSSLAILTAAALIATASAKAASLAMTGSIRGPDGGWDFVSVDRLTHRLYVAREYGVMAVDLASGQVTPMLIKGDNVHGVLPLPGGAMVSTNDNSSTAT